jgi:hypothetical protein
MRSSRDWQILLGIAFVALSALVYLIHYVIFRDVHHIFIYLIGDIAFVFIEVLMVTLIIHQVLSLREKRSILDKLNMVIGAFFSEVGTDLLHTFSRVDSQSEEIKTLLTLSNEESDQDLHAIAGRLANHDFSVEPDGSDLAQLQSFLIGKRDFLLRLLENPNLLEHESFTGLLWAVFHLTDELAHREGVHSLPATDRAHLAGDIQRAYGLLTVQWLSYMKHLRDNYPYLFSLAMRTNPFDPTASAQVV